MSGPLVTLALPCHREPFLAEALESVLAQTYSPLEIIVSDDASTDGTEALVRERLAAYDGPHETFFHRNDRQMGVENYNAFMELARGEFVVVAHSDDVSLPNRVERLVEAWREHDVSMVSSNGRYINEAGAVGGWILDPEASFEITALSLARGARSEATRGFALAWDREVFDRFGPLDRRRAGICTDYILPFRAALLRGVLYVPECLLHSRLHPHQRTNLHLAHRMFDRLARDEAFSGNTLGQLSYMLDTLRASRADLDRGPAELDEVERCLEESVQRAARRWSEARNELTARGRRVEWSPVRARRGTPLGRFAHRLWPLARRLLGAWRRRSRS